MNRKLVCSAPGKIEWIEVPERPPLEDEVRVRPTFGVEKHGTMAAFVKGYANERGRWDGEANVHRPEGMVWDYPIELGNMQFGLTAGGEKVAWWGSFQSAPVVRKSSLRALGGVDWRDAAMLDPGEFAIGALRDGEVRIGDNVAIFGLGAIGLALVQLSRTAGAARVFALDPIESRRRIAEEFGAITFDPSARDAGMALRETTQMRGVDVTIDYSGSWRALQAAFRGTGYGGTICYGAYSAPFPAGLDLGGEAHMNRQRLIFSRACSSPDPDHPRWTERRIIDTTWEFIVNGELKGKSVVDDPVPFDDLLQVYPDIAAHPETHLKLSVKYAS